MSTLVQKQILPSGLPLNISALPKHKTVMYAGTPGNTDAFKLLMSSDGVNYTQILQIQGPGSYSIPEAINYLMATWTPTPQVTSALGVLPVVSITPVLYVSGTFEDGVNAVVTTSTSLPLAVTGGLGPSTTLTLFDNAVTWSVVDDLGNPGPWLSNSVYPAGTIIAVPRLAPLKGTNYWLTLLGGTTATSVSPPIPAGLTGAQTIGTPGAVTDNTVTWYAIPAWQPSTTYTSASNQFVVANSFVFSVAVTGLSAAPPATGPTGVNYDGTTAWNYIEPLFTPPAAGSPVGTPSTPPLAWAPATTYAANALISVPRIGGGTNYWICTTTGTSAPSGTVPATLTASAPGLGATYPEIGGGTAVWTFVSVWALATAYTKGVTNYVYANGNVYLCAQTGESVINPGGPGAYLYNLGSSTSGFFTRFPDNLTAVYANGRSGEKLTLMGSPDGANWAPLLGADGAQAVFSGAGQWRVVVPAAVLFIGVLTQTVPVGEFAVNASENALGGAALSFGGSVSTVNVTAVGQVLPATLGAAIQYLTATGGSISLTAAPAAGKFDGQIITYVNNDASHTVTFNSAGTGTPCLLGASSRIVGVGGSLTLQWNATLGKWRELTFVTATS